MVAVVEEKVKTVHSWWGEDTKEYYQLFVSDHNKGESIYISFTATNHHSGMFIPLAAAEFIGQRAAEIRAAQAVGVE